MARLVPAASPRDKHSMAGIPALLRPIVDFALPPRCAGCGVVVADDDQLCVTCWETLDFLTGAGCALCGDPAVANGLTCASCLASPPRHDGVRAAVAYDDLARSIVLRLKHGRRTGLARLIAAAMARHVPRGDLLIIPVPLHRWRIWSRGFNQSALLANQLAKLSGHKVDCELLLRTKFTPLLRGLGAKDRAKAVQGVFALNPKRAGSLRGKTILLIDDVYTSGATTNACARILKRGGATKVIILCWARVIKND